MLGCAITDRYENERIPLIILNGGCDADGLQRFASDRGQTGLGLTSSFEVQLPSGSYRVDASSDGRAASAHRDAKRRARVEVRAHAPANADPMAGVDVAANGTAWRDAAVDMVVWAVREEDVGAETGEMT